MSLTSTVLLVSAASLALCPVAHTRAAVNANPKSPEATRAVASVGPISAAIESLANASRLSRFEVTQVIERTVLKGATLSSAVAGSSEAAVLASLIRQLERSNSALAQQLGLSGSAKSTALAELKQVQVQIAAAAATGVDTGKAQATGFGVPAAAPSREAIQLAVLGLADFLGSALVHANSEAWNYFETFNGSPVDGFTNDDIEKILKQAGITGNAQSTAEFIDRAQRARFQLYPLLREWELLTGTWDAALFSGYVNSLPGAEKAKRDKLSAKIKAEILSMIEKNGILELSAVRAIPTPGYQALNPDEHLSRLALALADLQADKKALDSASDGAHAIIIRYVQSLWTSSMTLGFVLEAAERQSWPSPAITTLKSHVSILKGARVGVSSGAWDQGERYMFSNTDKYFYKVTEQARALFGN